MKRRPIVLLLLGLALCAEAQAQWWNPNDPTPPKFRGTQWATPPVYTHQMLENAAQQVHVALETGDFAKVERMYAEFLETRLRTNDGLWMLESVQRTLHMWFGTHDEARIRRFFAEWAEKIPDSKLRPIAQADMWQSVAWEARGRGYASNVTPEGWQMFRERLAKASEAVDASEAIGRDSPYWYWVALGVAGSTGRPEAQFDALFDRAATRFPSYQPLYSARLNYLMPQWGGDFDKVDRFIDAAVRRTAAAEGNTFYARLYMDVSKGTFQDSEFFRDSRVSWPRMRESFEELNRRYPDSWNKSLYAGFACRVRDRETTARLLQDMKPNAEVFAFKDGISMDTCRRFAFDRS